MRFTHQREFYIPAGSTSVADPESSAVVYTYESNGRICAVAFHGRAQKPDWNFRFASIDARDKRIDNHFRGVRSTEAYRRNRHEERTAFQHSYKPGDIFRTCWGYDQTNVEYYECLEVRGKHLIVVEIEQGRKETQWLRGQCVPMPGKPRGEPFRVLAQKTGFRINGHIWASFEQPEMVGGVPTYAPASWTAYA